MALLTDAENKIADMVAFGIDLNEISAKLSLTPEKTREHINNICKKICYRQTVTLEQAVAMSL